MAKALGLWVLAICGLNSLTARPSGEYRVLPLFPDEVIEPAQNNPENQSSPRRALIIQPDGTVNGQEAPEIEPSASIPGANGMDGIPIDPTQPVTLEIEYPSDRQILPSQDVDVFIRLNNYQLGEKDSAGNRLHYILNNDPPRPIYDAISPITIRNLSQGGHTIRVFAVRPDGRMFRNEEAFAIRHFYVIRKDFQNYTDPGLEYLTVNLPSGEQVATDEEGRIIFDYKLHNIEAGQGYELRYKIGAYEGFLAQDGPVYWSNLAAGKHIMEVELLKPNRQPAIGPFNRVKREFSVARVKRAEPVEPIPAAEVVE